MNMVSAFRFSTSDSDRPRRDPACSIAPVISTYVIFSAPRSIGRESFTPRSTAISSPAVTSSATVLFRVSVSMSFISCLLFSQRRRTASPAYYLSAKPKRGANAVRHNVLAVLPVDVVQQVDFPQRAIVNTQLVVGVFDSVCV